MYVYINVTCCFSSLENPAWYRDVYPEYKGMSFNLGPHKRGWLNCHVLKISLFQKALSVYAAKQPLKCFYELMPSLSKTKNKSRLYNVPTNDHQNMVISL